MKTENRKDVKSRDIREYLTQAEICHKNAETVVGLMYTKEYSQYSVSPLQSFRIRARVPTIINVLYS